MNPTREEALFALALTKPGAERAAWLDRECADDPALRQRLEALLIEKEDQGAAALNAYAAGVPCEDGAAELAPTLLDEATVTEGPGTVIGRYKLLEQIGEGGCGVVYQAEQAEPVKRRVALKVIKLGMDTRQVIARFEAERQALALMDHPNIAKVLDGGTTEAGRPFFVMELVKGVPITRYCDERRLDTTQRLELFILVCQAIQHAHQKGIVHRDIKPSNILVADHEGTPVPKVIDFGIAKATAGQTLTDKTVFTALEQFIGTPAYMSPEQAEMSGLDIDTRSDIYSLGVLLYELLTGKTPFDTKELLKSGFDEMRRMIRESEPPKPSTRLTQMRAAQPRGTGNSAPRTPHFAIDDDLDWIVMKCLEKDRNRRYETANGLARDIDRHLTNEPVVARPPSVGYRLEKSFRRNKLIFTATGVVGLALVLGVLVSSWQAVRATRAEQEQNHLREEAEKARQNESVQRREADQARNKEAQLRRRAESEELASRQRSYASDMNLIQQALVANNLGRAQDLLNRQRPQADQKDLREWEWRYLWQHCQSDALYELCRRPIGIVALAASSQDKFVAIGGEGNGELSVWDLAARKEVRTLPAGEGGVQVAFSPVRSLLAFSYAGDLDTANRHYGVRFWDGETSRIESAELSLPGECRGLAFSADGQRLITCTTSPDDALEIWRIPGGTRLRSYPARQTDADGSTFAATPDLSLAAVVEEDGMHGRIRVIDLATGTERWNVLMTDNFITTAVAFSPDAKLLAAAGGYLPSPIHIYEVATGLELKRLPGHDGWISALVFWPDGQTLASAGSDQTIRLWDVASLTNVPSPRILRGHRLEVWQLARLRESGRLVSGCKDGSVCLWDSAAPLRQWAHLTLPATVTAWRFTPNSKAALTLDSSGHVVQYSGETFQQAQSLIDIPPTTLLNFGDEWRNHLFSRDGRLLATGSTDGKVQVWDLNGRTLRREFTNLGAPWTREFLAHGQKLIIVNTQNESQHELDLTTGQEARTWGAGRSGMHYYSAISSNERWSLSMGRRSLLKDMTTDHELRSDLTVGAVSGLAFSPDGNMFGASSQWGFAEVWETAKLQRVAKLAGFLQGVRSVAWSPNSKRLALGGDGREAIKLWDMETYEELLTLEADGSVFSRSEFSPDGNLLGSLNREGVLHLWRAPSWEDIAAAEAKKKAEVKQP